MKCNFAYLDNHATTQVDPRVVEAMIPYFTMEFGNPASTTHAWGDRAREAVEQARVLIANAIGASADEIVFTSGATESNNLALKGVMLHPRQTKRNIISLSTEHRAVLDPLKSLVASNFDVTLLPVIPHGDSAAGLIELDRFEQTLNDQTALVSIMAANNEIGVLQPLRRIGEICRQRGVLFHSDAAQMFGRCPIDVRQMNVDLLSLSAHKVHAPKGVGALYVRGGAPRVRLLAQMDGGGHERGMRSGTLNVPGIMGFAKAVEIAITEDLPRQSEFASMRDRLFERLQQTVVGIELNGPALGQRELRLAQNLNLQIAGVEGAAVSLQMPCVAVSTGSACTSAEPAPSHVLQALGLNVDQSRSSLRFGLSRFTDDAQIDFVVDQVSQAVAKLRAM
jgi:cysteine desulfurase